ncbi:MAG: hypothetical protein PUB98_01385 [Clostridiales bacterium]|nr:hypothetical protein [Clostridiales bacterium]
MEEKIQKLYESLNRISVEYLLCLNRNNVKDTGKLMPEIEEFARWFLQENIFGIEQDLYEGMSNNLLQILNDIVTAMEQNDRVLLNDAVTYGLLEYLKLFAVQGEDSNDNL